MIDHYELAGDHFAGAQGYESYRDSAATLRTSENLAKMAETYLSVQACGSPAELIDQAVQFREILGPYDLNCCFRYASISLEQAESSLRTYATAVLPELKGLAA